jgi:micrococcal nuclease
MVVETPIEAGAPNCHPSYLAVCIPPPPPDLNCDDVPYNNITVRYDVPNPDPHEFDRDRDRIGCES